MSVIDILTVGMKGFEIALRLWDQYQYRKDALKHVQMYMTKLQMYQHAFQSLVDHVQKQMTNNPSIINDPTWKQDLQLFLEYAKEDQIESQRLESDLKEAHHHPWYKKQTWTKDENRIHEKIQMITWFTTSDLWRSKQEELTKFTKLLTEPEARSFWISEIGAEHDISLEVISSKLQHYLREHQWLSSERNYDTHLGQILRHTADVILPNGRISAKEWNNFVVRFGPIDGHMLTKATSVCVLDSPHHAPQPWFVTHDDRLRLTSAFDAAKAAYDATHPDEVAALATATSSNSAMSPKQKSSLYRFSTWALRFSQVATEPFVWSFWIGIRPQPQHFLIRNSAEGYYLKDAVGTESFRYHDTPVELIAYHSKKLAPGLHVDISHLQQWKEFFAPPAPPESRYACSGEIEILEGDDVELDHVEIGMTTTTTTTTTTAEGQIQETTTVAAITEVTTTSTASTSASEPTPATKPDPESSPVPTPVASAPEPESTPTPTPSAPIPEQPTYTSSQTIIETKSRVAHEQNMIIIIDRIEEVKPDSVKPVVDTNVTSPASTTTSSPSSTARSDSDPDLAAAASAAAAADALEKAKDITIVTPDPRASKPKPVADDDARRGPIEPTPKPVKTCCMIM